MHPFLNIATTAARKAGTLITRAILDLNTLKVQEKGRHDYVTEIDHQAEHIITSLIRQSYPSHGILGEESGHHPGDEYTWVIDPLDGTKNFVHGFPHLCISIAIKHRNRLEHGLIYDPFRDELFLASRGQGARLNNYRIRVASLPTIQNALVATALPITDPVMFNKYVKIFHEINPSIAGVRFTGSAALTLAYVAAGRIDLFWENNLREWDLAAGALIVREAGGFVTDFKGNDDFLNEGNIIAGNVKLVRQFLPLINHG